MSVCARVRVHRLFYPLRNTVTSTELAEQGASMQMGRSFILLTLVVAMAGCTTIVREQRGEGRPPPRVVIRQMPAPVLEVRTSPPGRGYAWVQGHWVWQHTGWVWQTGHWYQGAVQQMPPLIVEQITVAPGRANFWVPGHWQWRNGRWDWRNGHWQV